MFKIRLLKLFLLFLLFLLLPSAIATAGVPDVSNIIVTDVTTSSFSVIWTASEASIANLQVYEDDLGTTPLFEGTITPHPIESGDLTIKTMAEDNGVMKVRVTGLLPETNYYFKTVTTSKSSDETRTSPDMVDLPLPVKTEKVTIRTEGGVDGNVPFSNDLIVQECYLADGVTPADGTLLVATIEGADFPLTSFVGDGVASPYSVIDLNNAYVSTGESLDLLSRENLTLINFRGRYGTSAIVYEVSPDNGFASISTGENFLRPGWNMVSFPLQPTNTGTIDVLSPILDKVDSIWAFDEVLGNWVFYDMNGLPFLNDLVNIDWSEGYWLLLSDMASLKIEGLLSVGQIELKSGWNLVGSKWLSSIDIMKAVEPIFDQLVSIWTFDTELNRWSFYDKGGIPFLNNLKFVLPGKAYWIYVQEDCLW